MVCKSVHRDPSATWGCQVSPEIGIVSPRACQAPRPSWQDSRGSAKLPHVLSSISGKLCEPFGRADNVSDGSSPEVINAPPGVCRDSPVPAKLTCGSIKPSAGICQAPRRHVKLREIRQASHLEYARLPRRLPLRYVNFLDRPVKFPGGCQASSETSTVLPSSLSSFPRKLRCH